MAAVRLSGRKRVRYSIYCPTWKWDGTSSMLSIDLLELRWHQLRSRTVYVHCDGSLGTRRSTGFDTTKLVLSGASSGGWFAVAAGLGVRPRLWEEPCPGSEDPKVAAIVNWFGNWDLADVLEGPNAKPYAAGWIRGFSNPLEVARSLMPLPLPRRELPGVISIHGDADPTVPYSQSVRLHHALKTAGVAEEMVTIPSGQHGGFARNENQRAFAAIEAFLTKLGIR